MTTDAVRGIADPTIAKVLAEFLDEQRRRLAPRTYAQYDHVIDLLQHCLNGYAYSGLDKADAELFDRLYKAKGDEHREFCGIFGPEHILPNVDEFLGYFMVRKVMCGKDLLRAAGTVTKKLAAWLAAKGHAEADEAEIAKDLGGDASRDLPAAKDLAEILGDFADEQPREGASRTIEGRFSFTRVEAGSVWIAELGDRELGPIAIPAEITGMCRAGWTFSGAVALFGKTWRIVEVWNVYP